MLRRLLFTHVFRGTLSWARAFVRRRERARLHRQLDPHILRDIGFEPEGGVAEPAPPTRPGWAIDRW